MEVYREITIAANKCINSTMRDDRAVATVMSDSTENYRHTIEIV